MRQVASTSVGRPARVLNVFAGAGGLALGFEQAGFAMDVAVEPDPVHAATFQRNFPNATTLCMPVDSEEILSRVGGATFDVVAGSLPSSAFSVGGRHDPDDDRRLLLDRFVDVVAAVQPAAYVLEAVPGILSRANGGRLRGSLERLERGGYGTPQFWKLDAADFAVPQTRLRVWAVGVKEGVNEPTVPVRSVLAVHRRPSGLPVTPRDGLDVGPAVWDAIGDLPNPDDHYELRTTDRMRDAPRPAPPSPWARPLAEPVPIGCSSPRAVDLEELTASQATAHTMSSVLRFARTPPGAAEPVSRFYRLHAEGLSRTLRAGTGRDRGCFMAPRPLHPAQPRVITVREGARLQGFPDWFGFNATKWHGFFQVGSSAPPAVARAVAERLLAVLGHEPQKSPRDLVPDEHLLFLDLTHAARRMGATVLPEPRRRGTRRPRPARARPDSPQLTFGLDSPIWS